jgi:hypothetical protein
MIQPVEMTKTLPVELHNGADVNKSGAPWATPLAWAQKKGFADIEADLRQAGTR